jgi:Rrf2 family protein
VDITRKSDYAIRMMTALAVADTGCPVSVRELAEQQNVPYAFARSVARDLVAAGFVAATRGTAGGLCLARPAADITLLQIVEAIQGRMTIAVCTNEPAWCARSGRCSTHGVWEEADAAVRGLLARKTLAGLATR